MAQASFEPIAFRTFEDADGATVTLSIGRTERAADREDRWRCSVSVAGPFGEILDQAPAVDSLQALLGALHIGRANLLYLAKEKGPLLWLGDRGLGFDLQMPD